MSIDPNVVPIQRPSPMTRVVVLPEDLVAELQEVADDLGISLEQLVIGELRDAFGIPAPDGV